MGLINGDSTSHSDTSSSSNTTFTPDPGQMEGWNNLIGGAEGQREFYVNTPPPQATVADPTDLTNEYWNKAKGQTDFDTEYYHQPLRETYGETSGARIDPNNINFKQDYQFAPGTVDFNDPWKTGVPTVGKGGGLGATAADYAMSTERVKADQVQAERISAPGSIDRISGLERVSGPNLEQYQMGPAQQVSGPGVRDFQMGPAERVTAPELQQYQMGMSSQISPTGLASTQSWTDPGVAQSFMSPYQQNVVEQQKKRALEDWQVQNQMLGSEAAKAGAFGGSRHAVREATAARDMEDQMAMLQATGLQSAYQQGQNQFNTQQQLGLGAQQFNLGQGMQAQMSNQAMEQAMRQANLQSQLQTQGLGAQMSMQGQLANQAAGLQVGQTNLGALQQAEALRQQFQMQGQLANQAAGLQVGQANLGANLQTQGLGATLGQQADLANQQQTFNQGMANQQASKFEREQQLQASLANQSTGLQGMMANQGANLQAGLANQATNFQSGLASMQMGQQGAMFNAQQGMQAGLANQAANMTAMGQQYAGGLQGALQTQNLGFQGQVTGGQMNQASQFQQEQARQNAMGFNLNALQAQGQMGMNMANLGLAGQQANLATQESRARAAESQQGHAQQQADVNYANAMQNYMTPLQINQWMANMMAQRPMPYSQSSTGTQNTNSKGPTPGLLNTIVGAGTTAAGMMMPGKKAHGGLIDAYRRGGRVLRYAEGGLGDTGPGRYLYTTPEGLLVYAPKKKVTARRYAEGGLGNPSDFDPWRFSDYNTDEGFNPNRAKQKKPPPAKAPLPAALNRDYIPPSLAELWKIQNPWLKNTMDFAEGAGSGPFKAAHGVSKIAHKLVPAIPEMSEDLAKEPRSTAGKVGSTVEQMGEFLLPASGVTKATQLVNASKLPRAAKLAAGLATDLGASAAVTGVQSGGDLDAMRNDAATGLGMAAILPGANKGLKALREAKAARGVRKSAEIAKQGLESLPSDLITPPTPQIHTPSNLISHGGLDAAERLIVPKAEAGGLDAAERLVLPGAPAPRARGSRSIVTPAQDAAERAGRFPGSEHLLPREVDIIGKSPETIQAFETLTRALPSAYQMSAVAKAGMPKRGWYAESSKAIHELFGDEAPRFTRLLAALSPRTSVELNLENTLSVWKNWKAAGSPTDPDQIKRIMGASVKGDKGEKSALHAWVPNAIRALSSDDPIKATLSGPKVDSFYHNLMGDVDRVTNDAWMASILGVNPDLFQGQGTKAKLLRDDPGLSGAYITASSIVRHAGKLAGLNPSEAQETIWSVAMPLYELAKKHKISPQAVLDRGLLTPKVVGGTPDFATLVKDPRYSGYLEQAGYGQQLENLKSSGKFPGEAVSLSSSEQQELDKAAARLGETMRHRGMQTRTLKVPVEGQPHGFAYEQFEAIPGPNTGMFPKLARQKWGVRKNYSDEFGNIFLDTMGRDKLGQSMNLKTPEKGIGIGAFQPETLPGKPKPRVQFQPQHPFPVELPMSGKTDVFQEHRDKMDFGAAARGYAGAQEAWNWNLAAPKEGGLSHYLPLFRKEGVGKAKKTLKGQVNQNTMRQAVKEFPDAAFAHHGKPGLHVLNLSDKPFTTEQKTWLQKRFKSGEGIDTENIGNYVNNATDWARDPGSGAMTKDLVERYEKLSPEVQAKVDLEIRDLYGKVHQFYTKRAQTKALKGDPKRNDLLNALSVISTEGMAGAKKAVESGAFVPAVVGAILAPSLLSRSEQDSLQ